MEYNKLELHCIVEKIPKGKITTPSFIAKTIGLNPENYKRAVGQEVCNCKIPVSSILSC
jgi:alkylated DNA nucleotide flippase Atl1